MAAVPEAGVAEPVVRVASLCKRYGRVEAVRDLNFSLEAGTITAFLGPNGAGKSTTLRILMGLAQPTSGEAVILGRWYRDLDHPAQSVGAVLESGDFHPGRSGRNHLRALALAAGFSMSRVEEMLQVVGISRAADRLVGTYSLGMRQRLGLAGALLGNPQLLILDEPANGLDPAGVHWLRVNLRRFADRGGTVLMSSHVLAEVAQTVDRVLIILGGSIVASVSLGELSARGVSLEEVYLSVTSGKASRPGCCRPSY
jgi:ABC-2 type transport system ATP-binding protein